MLSFRRASQCLLLSLLCLATGAIAQDKLTLALDWLVNPNHAPIIIAQEKGYFIQQGLAVEILAPANPEDPLKFVASGKVDIAVSYPVQLLESLEQGLPLVRFAALIDKPLACMAVQQNRKSLEGATIGYAVEGADTAMIATILRHQKLTEEDTTLINVRYNLLQAFLAKKVDAIMGVMRNVEWVILKEKGATFYLLCPEELGMPSHDELIFVAPKHRLQRRTMTRFIKALTKAQHFINKHPNQAWHIFVKAHPELNTPTNKKIWLATLPYLAKSPASLNEESYYLFNVYLQKADVVERIYPTDQYTLNLGVSHD